jgi:hypothetical protein
VDVVDSRTWNALVPLLHREGQLSELLVHGCLVLREGLLDLSTQHLRQLLEQPNGSQIDW